MDLDAEALEALGHVNETNRRIGASVYYIYPREGVWSVGGHLNGRD